MMHTPSSKYVDKLWKQLGLIYPLPIRSFGYISGETGEVCKSNDPFRVLVWYLSEGPIFYKNLQSMSLQKSVFFLQGTT